MLYSLQTLLHSSIFFPMSVMNLSEGPSPQPLQPTLAYDIINTRDKPHTPCMDRKNYKQQWEFCPPSTLCTPPVRSLTVWRSFYQLITSNMPSSATVTLSLLFFSIMCTFHPPPFPQQMLFPPHLGITLSSLSSVSPLCFFLFTGQHLYWKAHLTLLPGYG